MIWATSTLVKELSLMTCSPRRTLMADADCPSVQWAAVRTCWGEIRVPPQKGVRPKALTSPTCQGFS